MPAHSHDPTPPTRGRIVTTLITLTTLPILLTADTLLAFARGWWTTSSLYLVVLSLSTLIIVLALSTTATRRGRAFLSRGMPQLVLLTTTLTFGWVVLEVAVSLTFRASLLFHLQTPGVQRVLNPRPELVPGITGPARYTTNSQGIRGPELPPPDEAWRLLCIGGSTTACLYLDDLETWPRLLKHELDGTNGRTVWVGDNGQSGYGSWQHVRFLERSDLPARMDSILLLLGVNDFMRAMQGRRIDSAVGARPIWDRSPVLTVLHNIYQARKEARQHRVEEREASSLDFRREQWQKSSRRDELPDLSAGLAQYRTNIRSMIALARGAGARPIFATQPVLWRDGLSERAQSLLWLGSTSGEVPPLAELRAGMARFNRALQAICAEERVECADLSSMDGQEPFFYDDCHFTEAGAKEVARILAAFFRERGLVPGR